MRGAGPSNRDAERAVLGSMLLEEEAVRAGLDHLTTDDFQIEDHRRIFEAMQALDDEGVAIDDITVCERLVRSGNGRRGIITYVAELSTRTPTAVNLPHWARIVRENAVARRLACLAGEVRNKALQGDVEAAVAQADAFETVADQRASAPARPVLVPDESWPRLGEAALHGLAGDYVRALAPHTEADPVAILVQLLVAFGNMAGRGPHFLAEADEHHANEFAVLVGSTAKGRKGSSWGHVRRLCDAVDPEWTRKRIRAGLASGEGLVHAVRDQETGEEADDPRLLVLESEFASTLAVSRRDGNTLSATVRNAWDSVSLGNLTKGDAASATSPHISIIGHITQDELRTRLKAVEVSNGFANRFLWVCVRRAQYLPEGGRFGRADAAPFAERLAQAVAFARTVGRMARDENARTLWNDSYRWLSAPKVGVLDSLTCRSEAHVMRLSCLYALLDRSDVVRVEHLSAALAVWGYVEASCRLIFGDESYDPTADTILEALRKTPDGLSRTEISGLFCRSRKASVIRAALGTLAAQGLVASERIKTGGAPKEIWRACLPQLGNESGVDQPVRSTWPDLVSVVSDNSCPAPEAPAATANRRQDHAVH